jgi:hypothetical protein
MLGSDRSKNPIAAPLVILLAGIVLLCAGVLSFVIFDMIKDDISAREAEDPRACLTIRNDAERLSCLETRVGRASPPPAHGANAPANIFR